MGTKERRIETKKRNMETKERYTETKERSMETKQKSIGTKQRIMEEALTLFAKKGYDGTNIKEIADAVAIKDSSLYKHYKSKKEIFHTIVETMGQRMEQLGVELNLPDFEHPGSIALYESIDLPCLIDLTQRVFLFYAKDDFAGKFRRMLSIEQYKDSEASSLYRKIYMEDSIRFQTMVFQQLVNHGILDDVNPSLLAMNYYAPIFYLICRYDNDAENEQEALELVKQHVEEFYRIYHKKK